MDEIRPSQPQRAGDNPETGLEVHELEDAGNEQQDADAIEGKVPD